MRIRKWHAVILAGALLPLPALARAGGKPVRGAVHRKVAANKVITVLASGVPEPLRDTGQAITVFDRAQIQQVQGPDISRLLVRAPGVSISRNGPPGAFTGLFVRGAASEQVLVLIDGVPMADVAAPSGGFDLGTLSMGNLAKVELERGSNSTIWGSDAIGGVLAVTTLAENGAHASVEGGTRGSFYTTGGVGGHAGPVFLSINGGLLGDRGFSAAADGTEKDGFHQDELDGTARFDAGHGLQFFARGRFARGRSHIDGFPPPDYVLADTLQYQVTRQLSGVGGMRYRSQGLDLTLDFARADTGRQSYDPTVGTAPTYTTEGTMDRVQLRGRAALGGPWAVDFGGSRKWTSFATLFSSRQRTATTGVYGQFDYDQGGVHLHAGLRHDQHRDFGGQWSFGTDGALDLGDGWRLTASYGEGFKAPSLFQLLSDYGNTHLRPETSRSYDIGINGATGPLRITVNAFRRDTSALIDFVSCHGVSAGICTNRPYGTYDNVGSARAQGVEVQGQFALGRALTLDLAYTHQTSRDRATGLALARRPDDFATLTGNWQVTPRLLLGADLRAVSHSFDNAADTVRLAPYATMALRAQWQATAKVQLFARVTNLWNEHYQTVAGYGTAGRAAFIGARARWR